MTKYTTLAKAIAYVIAGGALSVGTMSTASATTTTMYNLSTAYAADNSAITGVPCAPCNPGGTDGWVWGYKAKPLDSTHSVAKWAGTSGTNITPFGYQGGGVLHWAVEMTGGGTAEISSQDAVNRYGVAADIDTAKGAWSDAALTGASGWRHDLEYGLFKSDISGKVTLNAQGILQSGTNFGFTIFKGMDTSTLKYNHHGDWNYNNNTLSPLANTYPNLEASFPPTKQGSTPGGGTTFDVSQIVAYSIGGATPSNLNTISFDAEAGQTYTIVLGGYKNGDWGATTDGYKLTVSQVPVPGALWLFGSAMAGLIGIQRRKQPAA